MFVCLFVCFLLVSLPKQGKNVNDGIAIPQDIDVLLAQLKLEQFVFLLMEILFEQLEITLISQTGSDEKINHKCRQKEQHS